MTKMLSTASDFSTTKPVRYFTKRAGAVVVDEDAVQPAPRRRQRVGAGAEPEPVVLVAGVDREREQQPQADPQRGPAERLLDADDVRTPVEHAQIERQQADHERDEDDVDPEHGGRAAVAQMLVTRATPGQYGSSAVAVRPDLTVAGHRGEKSSVRAASRIASTAGWTRRRSPEMA